MIIKVNNILSCSEDCLPEDFECKTRDQFASDSNVMKTVTDYKELLASKQSTSKDKG